MILRLTLFAALLSAVAWPAAAEFAAAIDPGMLCRSAIHRAEIGSTLPPHMLGGIARVESGRTDPKTGRFAPWPWSINAEGRDFVFETKAEAITFARNLQARGVRSFDVGCLQVNMMFHPDAFANLEEAFDPLANARYAVRFLTELYAKTGNWDTASAWYHSANPEHGVPYRARVVTAMADEAKAPGAVPTLPENGGMPGAMGTGMAMGGMSSMPRGIGAVMMMHGSTGGGVVLQRPSGNVVVASASGNLPQVVTPGAVFGGTTTAGRGLDSYRMAPIRMIGPRLIAAR
jgi:hypothetical protein